MQSERYSCPACKRDGVGGQARCTCGADLELLWRLDEVADHWFNTGLASLAAGNRGRALEWLAACCVARPSDAAAHGALARVWAQLGHGPEAEDALARARDLDPDAPDLATIGEGLTAARAVAVGPGLVPAKGASASDAQGEPGRPPTARGKQRSKRKHRR